MEQVETEMTMWTRPTEYPHILWNEDKGLPCISGTRLRVQDVVAQYQAGWSVDEIHAAHPSHSLAEILSALAYYYDHQRVIERAGSGRSAARTGTSPTRQAGDACGTMTMSLSYYFDQHVPGPVTAGLRHRRISVLTTEEDGRITIGTGDLDVGSEQA